MQRSGFQTFSLQRTGQSCATEFAVHKNEGLLHPAGFKNLVQRAALVIGAHAVEMLFHGRSGGVRARHFNRYRVLQVAGRKTLDFGRKSGREQERDALLGQVAQDALQIG